MEQIELTYPVRFLIALGLGILMGLERETTARQAERQAVSGVRTFALVSLLGFGCA